MKMIDYNLLKGKITAMQSTEPEYAFNFLNNALNPSTEWECIEDMLDNMEVYEAEPVKHGRWICNEELYYNGMTKCSCCNSEYYVEDLQTLQGDADMVYFCPKCGADMRGDTNG